MNWAYVPLEQVHSYPGGPEPHLPSTGRVSWCPKVKSFTWGSYRKLNWAHLLSKYLPAFPCHNLIWGYFQLHGLIYSSRIFQSFPIQGLNRSECFYSQSQPNTTSLNILYKSVLDFRNCLILCFSFFSFHTWSVSVCSSSRMTYVKILFDGDSK